MKTVIIIEGGCVTGAHSTSKNNEVVIVDIDNISSSSSRRYVDNCIHKALSEQGMQEVQYSEFSLESGAIWSLYSSAMSILMNHHISNGGFMDYSERSYAELRDAIEEVEIGYFGHHPDSSFQERLEEEGFSMTEDEAIASLSARIESIMNEMKLPLFSVNGEAPISLDRLIEINKDAESLSSIDVDEIKKLSVGDTYTIDHSQIKRTR